ncbi:MAG: DUF2059 domain-containing protein [Chitinophagales bacterium]|nr:DUF2059 domain-containing protein [Hyphomicrobiales bacterium]
MTRIVIFIFAAFLSVFATSRPGIAQDAPDPARVAAAQDLMNATGVSKQLDGMMTSMISRFQQDAAGDGNMQQGHAASMAAEAFTGRFASYKEEMLRDFAVLYATRFTAEEMKAVADFYRGETGSKFVQSMPELMQQGSQIGIKYAQKMMDDLKSGATPTAR